MQTAAAKTEYTESSTLFLVFELSNTKWKLGMSTGRSQKPRIRTIDASDLPALHREIAKAKERFSLPASAPVVSCYEAGRDGFWLHHHLVAEGIDNQVVDPASMEVNRRRRRAKTDRLDVGMLMRHLLRWSLGDRDVWSVVHVPSVEAEDERQLHRELETLKGERTRHTNRIGGLLATQGIRFKTKKDFLERLAEARLWDGSGLLPGLRRRLEREYERFQMVQEQIRELEAERRAALREAETPGAETARRLYRLRAIGENFSWLASMEFFAWRAFRNRREVGALAGLAPTPFASGSSDREQGIGKDGNRRIRAMTIEIAWQWLRHQPDSQLSRWFEERFGYGSRRSRRVGIVALSRKLLVALWRYLETGIVPEGAKLKPGAKLEA